MTCCEGKFVSGAAGVQLSFAVCSRCGKYIPPGESGIIFEKGCPVVVCYGCKVIADEPKKDLTDEPCADTEQFEKRYDL